MIGKISGILGIATTVVVVLFFIFDVRATAEQNEKELAEQKAVKEYHETRISNVEDLLLKQEAAAEAEAKLLAELCAAGKLEGEDCQ